MSQPNYCIIDPGSLPRKLSKEHGRYADMGARLLKRSLSDFNYEICSPAKGDVLPKPSAYDGYLIMGSEHSVNDQLPWILPLMTFIIETFRRQLPLVGICFGHQAIAKALGGKVAECGWIVGVEAYRDPDSGDYLKSIVYHQDQIVALPSCAQIEWTSKRCINAALSYSASPCWTIQSHPEFSPKFSWDLFENTRHEPLTDAQCDQAKKEVEGFEPDLRLVEARIRETFQI